MYSEDDLVQLSALQHFVFCPRQCALIHIEQIWEENRFTAEGRIMHERAHEEGKESSGDIRIERGMSLRSLELGLSGKADVVEFHRIFDERGWRPFPVEYKRGKTKPDNRDKVQLCAQALCLEEMLKTEIPFGALFYGRTRRRLEVSFDATLRAETKDLAARLHAFLEEGKTPAPVLKPECESCSLVAVCLPSAITKGRSVQAYLEEGIRPL